jgi:hypothetical protein
MHVAHLWQWIRAPRRPADDAGAWAPLAARVLGEKGNPAKHEAGGVSQPKVPSGGDGAPVVPFGDCTIAHRAPGWK